MIVVARNQQDGTVVAVNVHSTDGNLSLIVNLVRLSKLQARAGGNQSIQVNYGASVLPQKCSRTASPEIADDLF
jgi:hypothetical protein